jgi:hypothetical protein
MTWSELSHEARDRVASVLLQSLRRHEGQLRIMRTLPNKKRNFKFHEDAIGAIRAAMTELCIGGAR